MTCSLSSIRSNINAGPLTLPLTSSPPYTMIIYVFQWLQVLVVATPVNFAQDLNLTAIPNCTDDRYNWVSTRFASLLAPNRPE